MKPATLSVLLLLQIVCFVWLLRSFTYLPGTDAYYYALQAQSLLETGHLKVPDGGIVYYGMAALARAGLSIETSFRACLSIIFALYSLGLLFLFMRLKRGTFVFAVLLWMIVSSTIAFHVVEFPNLSLGLAMTPFWFYLLGRPETRSTYWLVLLLIASSFLHVMVFALAVLFAPVVVLARFIPGNARKRISSSALIAAVVVSIGIAIAIAMKWPGLGTRLASLHAGMPGAFALVIIPGIPFGVKSIVVLLWILLMTRCFLLLPSASKWRYLAVAVLVIPLWPDHDKTLFSLGVRLAVLFPLFALPALIFLYGEVGSEEKTPSWLEHPMVARIMVAAMMIGIVVLPIRLRAYRALLTNADYPKYESVVASLRREDISMLIAPRGLDFFYSYRLRRDAFHFDPEPEWDHTRIWRVAARVTSEEFAYYSPSECRWGEMAKAIPGTGYLLVREDCWQQFRARVSREENPDLYIEVRENSENPSQQRPEFLRARHRR